MCVHISATDTLNVTLLNHIKYVCVDQYFYVNMTDLTNIDRRSSVKAKHFFVRELNNLVEFEYM